MRSNIRECLHHNHPMSSSVFCPERLIDVGQDGIRLVLKDDIMSSEASATPQYAALSYCWGAPEQATLQPTTTEETLSARLQRIQESELSPVLLDAVAVTRALSIPYLWVDSLCILQDKASPDWAEQCSVMEQIYGCAHVTICALASASCNESFLSPNDQPSIRIPFCSGLNAKIMGDYKARLTYRTYATSEHFEGFRVAEREFTYSQWRTRGWTRQEYVLSTRVLAFGRATSQFRCNEMRQTYNGGKMPLLNDHQIDDIRQNPKGQKALYRSWRWTSEWASSAIRKGFTLRTDILPALAGQAKIYRDLLGVPETDYLAGLWKQDLAQELMWYVHWSGNGLSLENHVRDREFPDPYIAPSWSWASAKSNIFYHGLEWNAAQSESSMDAWTVLKSSNLRG